MGGGSFGREQREVDRLKHCWAQVWILDGKEVQPGPHPLPHFVVQKGLLYCVAQRRGQEKLLLVVPRTKAETVLELAHSHPMAGHLGPANTVQRIRDRFHWSGMDAEVKLFCQACPTCQVTSPRKPPPSPLIPLPIIERFNQTLKQMLRRVVAEDKRDWDLMIPYVLFGIREVPQASTGFTPFELLFGRQPRGLLDVAKEAWEQQPAVHRSVIEHVREMRERIDRVMPLVREHLSKAQQAQQRHYNRAAQPREFHPGDRVMVLVPQRHANSSLPGKGRTRCWRRSGR